MYIVRWLMGHPIIATWVLGAIAILLAFGSGSQNDHATVVKEDNSVNESIEEVKADIKDKLTNGKIVSKPVVKTPTTENQNKTTFADSKTTKNEVIENDDGAKIEKAPKKPPFGASLEADDAVAQESKSNKGSVLNSTSTAAADLGQSTTEEMLLMAREAYWNNGLDEAAQIYEKLIEVEPKVLEHRGELGNVYWRQGYPKKAAELYSEIAIPMIEQGGKERVANMIGFIGLFYPDRAAEIHKQIQLKK